MHAYAPQRILRGRCGHLLRRLCRFAGIDPRRCLCVRCIAVRSGLFLRTRTWIGHRAFVDLHVFGIHISRRFAFEMPATAPTMTRTLDTAGGRSASGRDLRARPLVHVLGAHP